MSSSADTSRRPRGQASRAVAPEGKASDSTSSAPAGDQHAPPVALECVGVSKKYGETQAIEKLDLTVPESQIVALLGPSGCGKTTALRLIAGFDYPDAGLITIGGAPVFAPGRRTPPEKRRVGMVFQEGALFPHLTVEQNVAYGLSGSADRAERVSEVLDLVGLSTHRRRMPYELSGGQQQRVALARALAPRPEILLLDEPFSNLDPGLRGQVRDDVLTILRSNRITAIFVTHDQEEALYIGDAIVVMSQGRVEQIDSPEAIFHSPASRFVAGFIGAADFIPARLDGGALISEIGSVPWETVQQPRDFANGTGFLEEPEKLENPDHLEVMVRPDCLDCHPSDLGQGVISAREFRGAFYLYKVELPSGYSVRCLLSHTREYPVGTPVSVTLRDGHTLKPFWGGRSIDC